MTCKFVYLVWLFELSLIRNSRDDNNFISEICENRTLWSFQRILISRTINWWRKEKIIIIISFNVIWTNRVCKGRKKIELYDLRYRYYETFFHFLWFTINDEIISFTFRFKHLRLFYIFIFREISLHTFLNVLNEYLTFWYFS